MLGSDELHRFAVADAEDGAQRLVALDDHVERALKRRRVDAPGASGRRSACCKACRRGAI